MSWPKGARLLSVDRSGAMIRHVWPKAGLPSGAAAVRGDWCRLPVPNASMDIVIGDGVTFTHEARGLEDEIRRVLRHDGRYLLRAFVRPARGETLAQVHDDLMAGRIGSFHAYKWRLAMALHGSIDAGVRPAAVWEAWRKWVPDPDVLVRQYGWSKEVIATIDAYQYASAVYSFPTMAEMLDKLRAHFAICEIHTPSYELGERCPLLELRLLDKP
jgi:SAM-dependent methyltransferase